MYVNGSPFTLMNTAPSVPTVIFNIVTMIETQNVIPDRVDYELGTRQSRMLVRLSIS